MNAAALKPLVVNADGIPAELRSVPRWVSWRLETRGNDPKPTKVPYRADGRGKASSTDPTTWATFDAAYAAYRQGGYDGIGIVLHRHPNAVGPGLVGIDLDGVRNAATGDLQPWAAETVHRLASYAEVSPSGTGVHVYLFGELPPGKRKSSPVEVYETGRFFCVTGQRLDGAPPTVSDRHAELLCLYNEVFGSTHGKTERNGPGSRSPRGRATNGPDVRARAVAYMAKCSPAVSGQNGHGQTFDVARTIVYGFDLGPEVGFDLLWEHYNPRCVPPWSEVELRHKVREADAKPFDKPRGWLLAGRDGAEVLNGVSLSGLDCQAKATRNGTASPTSAGTSPARFEWIDSATFARTEYRLDWLVRRLLAKGQPCVVGGPKKGLKTSTLIDLALSLGTATPFLGHFDVYRRVRVGFMSGESGEATLKETALRVCAAKGIDLAEADVYWGFRLPQLANAAELAALREAIVASKVEVLVIDPLYLSLLSGVGGDGPQASNLYQMGPLLLAVAKTCLDVGCSPILAHHFKLARPSPDAPPGLEDLAFAGIQEFARQWMLTGRRERQRRAPPLAVGGRLGRPVWAVDVRPQRGAPRGGLLRPAVGRPNHARR